MEEIEERRKQLKKKYFPSDGLFIMSILGIFGLIILSTSGIFKIAVTEDFYKQLCSSGVIVIFGLFFVISATILWYAYIVNIKTEPKEEVLYLHSVGKKKYFLDRRGRKYENIDKKLEADKFYYVSKTRDFIYEIIDESIYKSNNFEPIEKINYWTNLYIPFKKYEDIVLLPFVYVIAVPGLLDMLISEGVYKIIGYIFFFVPAFIIIYDLFYKIKNKKFITIKIKDSSKENTKE